MPPGGKVLEELSDEALVRHGLSAHSCFEQAFEELYRRYSGRVLGFLIRLTGSRETAEDALQETFLRVYRSLDRFEPDRELISWLLQIARYVAIDAHRVEQKVKRLEESRARDTAERTPPHVAKDAAQSEAQQDVHAVLETLPLDDRSLLLLRHFHGLTFAAIGQAVDCSSRTAQNRVEAAARRFQQALLARRASNPAGPGLAGGSE